MRFRLLSTLQRSKTLIIFINKKTPHTFENAVQSEDKIGRFSNDDGLEDVRARGIVWTQLYFDFRCSRCPPVAKFTTPFLWFSRLYDQNATYLLQFCGIFRCARRRREAPVVIAKFA